ncbi:5-formyltetrahydrofolate cyclo-ligase [Crassaminicella thermophila]|uniref:5-formyltetrahydrofolate cyclo-ligase n=1 Tax=Crassaminicella thermophila TaxID=2599308 RepID=A0A5C0SAA2_CRATE|nr:5-formyltetrahydrofolate cyclo-ligase [Crassaminicella thermophila]QEK11485.1 5-formyltetrahydrofolate cyclo-ligase [Crassaminicella thermophila]
MKKIIREEILKKRKALSSNEITRKSDKIFHKLKTFPSYQNAENVMVYLDFRNEVKTNKIIDDLLEENKNVLIPISIPKTREMILSQLLDPKKELVKGTYGILEPKKEYIRKVNPEIVDLIIVPGVAFDPRGYRIGYGGGYYDRFLDKISKNVLSIALAFDLQIIDNIPNDSFDKPVDYIITETKIFSCK